MNSKKGKGKPKNKPPNPNPPQKDETEAEKLVTEESQSVPKCEERVPEIISEILPPLVVAKDKEEDSPKKPKRNRGKKKKQDKDDDNEDQTGDVEDVQLEIVEVEIQEVTVEENVAPSARKKKNKNKKITDPQPVTAEKIDKDIPLEETKTEKEETVLEEPLKTQEVSEQEVKSSKKKNKKKKQRNDSEKSDVKTEEVSCTSAFEMLLKEEKSDIKVTETEPIKTEMISPAIPKTEEMNITAFIQELEKVEDVNYLTQETKSSKNKKKNKKDKKEHPKDDEAETGANITMITAIKPVSTEQQLMKDCSPHKDHTSEIVASAEAKVDEDVKPKAKIAKPVERKRKDKSDKHGEEPLDVTCESHQESDIKDVTGSGKEEVTLTANVPKPSESETEKIKSESAIPAGQDNKENIQKPSEKKKKGKNIKHSDEIMLPEKVEAKDSKNIETIPILQQEIISDTTDTSKTNIHESGDTKLALSEEKGSEVTEMQQEIEKPLSKAERKRKNKKDTKSQDTQIQIGAGGVEPKKELITPEPSTKDTFKALEVGSPKEDEIKTGGDILPISLKEEIMSQTTSPPPEIKTTDDKLVQDNIKKQYFETKEKLMPEKMAEVADEIVNIPTQCELLKDIPLMADPIENVQTKQEIISDIDVQTIKSDTDKPVDIPLSLKTEMKAPEISKKRKKSPKPKKHEKDVKMVDVIPEVIAETCGFSMEQTFPPTTLGECKIEERKSPAIINLPMQEVKEEESKPIDRLGLMPLHETHLTPESEDKTPFETKMKKKRKKSPKLPQESIPEIAESVPTKSEDTGLSQSDSTGKSIKSEKSENVVQAGEGKSEILHDLPSAVEITTLKADECEDSSSGFTPDIIQHPRATSQDLIDDNNNTLIQEITIAEEAKLQIPLQIPNTPLIQGSGATPLETPDNVLVGIRITQADVDVVKKESEKTDVKSKMMEVNQDMEDLRLSIEKSLAELTAIEKSEEQIEKEYRDKTNIMEGTQSGEIKISMPSEIVAKSQLPKVEAQIEKEKTAPEKAKCEQMKSEADTKPSRSNNKPIETNIPPKISMFFDKELKDTDVQLIPDIIQEKKDIVSLSDILTKPVIVSDSTSQSVNVPIADTSKVSEITTDTIIPPIPPTRKDRKSASKERDNKDKDLKKPVLETKPTEDTPIAATANPDIITGTTAPPVCPARKDHKNKGKNKKKGKQDAAQTIAQPDSASTSTESKDLPKDVKKEEKTAQQSEGSQGKNKKQSDATDQNDENPVHQESNVLPEFEPIENFEDAMTSSADDINKTFEIIADEASRTIEASHVNPEIKIVAPAEDKKREGKRRDEKINPVSQPKNLLGHPDIPARLNKTDYKKEKNKTPNAVLAKVKIKDSVQIDANRQSKDTQTDNIKKFMKSKSVDESFASMTNDNDEFVYKYSFRKVFLQSACHVCKKDLKQTRVPCNFCNLIFYCNAKHKDEDWPQHQGLCFAVSTIVHLKDQKHIYADAKNITGQDYRLLRMQVIVACERVLKRKLAAWEQEALLYPRVCADAACREWRQNKLADCDGCGQISYCSNNPHHFPKSHQRWCKSYALYQKLVCHQQTKGRLELKLPSKVMVEQYRISEKINEALATMYEEKIDMNDIQYAALTQMATAPLTAAYCQQTFAATGQANGTYKKTACTVHIVGGELQFEADALNKWEVFFLHLRPQLQELRVVMVGSDLNPSNLPLELLGKVKLCETCRFNKRRVVFNFQDKTTYHDYRASEDFAPPDIVCAFNPSIKRCSMYNGKDPWPRTIGCVLKQKVPFLVSAHTINELQRDLARIKEVSEVEFKVVIEPQPNSFASVRPDRNFISDDEAPLLFKNQCYMLLCGAC